MTEFQRGADSRTTCPPKARAEVPAQPAAPAVAAAAPTASMAPVTPAPPAVGSAPLSMPMAPASPSAGAAPRRDEVPVPRGGQVGVSHGGAIPRGEDVRGGEVSRGGAAPRRDEVPVPRGGGRRVAADGPAAEAAVAYAQDLVWPLTPGFPVEGERCGCGREPCPQLGAHPVPGAWRVAACATPTLVRVVWRMCAGAPVLAVLGRPVPGAARLGAVQAPALIGVAALELLSKRSAAQGPVVDGHGRISFLVDLGDCGHAIAQDEEDFGRWRRAGMDLAVLGSGEERSYVPLPTPGHSGRSGVVWAVSPEPGRALPPLSAVVEVFDRAVRSTYPSLWSTVHAGWV